MSHRHAQRRGAPARPSERDIRLLQRLTKRARAAARDPEGKALPLVVAAEKAGDAILPLGFRGEAQCFVTLIRLGKGFLKQGHADRGVAGPSLIALADDCEAALGTAAEAPGPSRDINERKDIYG